MRDPKSPPEFAVASALRGVAPWLADKMVGRKSRDDVVIVGFTVNFDGGRSFVIVRGLNLLNLHHVVVFGSAEDLYHALLNASSAVRKAQWREDKYKKPVT